LTNSIDLRGVTTTAHTNANINIAESIGTQKQDGLEDLNTNGLGLNEFNRNSVDFDQTLAGLAISNGDGISAAPKGL